VDQVSQSDSEIPPSFGVLFRQLIDDLLAYFDAEREVYSVQARLSRRAAGWIGLYALGAVVVAQGGMIALVVGILLALVPVIGAGWATLAIVLICTLFAALFIWLIRLKLRSIKIAWRRRHER
jgi:Putative Actinobacterial Holin-X, holin superfamily III